MRLFKVPGQSFRPSQHLPARFWLWATLYTAGVVALFLLPEASFIWIMLTSLGAITGGAPSEPDRAVKPSTFIALVALTAAVVVAVGLAVWLPRPAFSPSAAARLVPMWLRLLAGVIWVIMFLRESLNFFRLRQPAAAA